LRKLFGTDGIRGVANLYPMTADMVMQIGRAIAFIFKNKEKRYRVLVGRDTRLSGNMIESALVSGICSMGVDVITVGHLPTPAVALLTTEMEADAGIMISAPHNPFHYNGLKIFSGNGLKLSDSMEKKRIEDSYRLRQRSGLQCYPARSRRAGGRNYSFKPTDFVVSIKESSISA